MERKGSPRRHLEICVNPSSVSLEALKSTTDVTGHTVPSPIPSARVTWVLRDWFRRKKYLDRRGRHGSGREGSVLRVVQGYGRGRRVSRPPYRCRDGFPTPTLPGSCSLDCLTVFTQTLKVQVEWVRPGRDEFYIPKEVCPRGTDVFGSLRQKTPPLLTPGWTFGLTHSPIQRTYGSLRGFDSPWTVKGTHP